MKNVTGAHYELSNDFYGLVRSVLVSEILPIFVKKKTLICLMTLALTLFLAGADSAPSLLPRGFSIIVPKMFDTGFGTF